MSSEACRSVRKAEGNARGMRLPRLGEFHKQLQSINSTSRESVPSSDAELLDFLGHHAEFSTGTKCGPRREMAHLERSPGEGELILDDDKQENHGCGLRKSA